MANEPKTGPFLSLENAQIRGGDGIAFADVSWQIHCDEHWAVVGPNGSGKSLLLRTLWGATPLAGGRVVYHFDDGRPVRERPWYDRAAAKSIQHVSFADQAHVLGAVRRFYQERWFSSSADSSIDVNEFLSKERIYRLNPYQILEDADYPPNFEDCRSSAIDVLEIRGLLGRKMLHLSSGEMRKVLLARALAQDPKLLILDDPCAGLDPHSKQAFTQTLQTLADGPMRLVFATSRLADVPAEFGRVLWVENGAVEERTGVTRPPLRKVNLRLPVRKCPAVDLHAPALQMEQVVVRYGDRLVLDDINWQVNIGEYWALVGANGSGKSTLLGLAMGDNPQAHANRVQVLGRSVHDGIQAVRRGIGWLAPDLQIHFPPNLTCLQTVCSGFDDTLGLFRAPTVEETNEARSWLAALGCRDFEGTPLGELSTGLQRMALFARAMVREPALLLLDEPCQGLDAQSQATLMTAIGLATARSSMAVVHVTHRVDDLPVAVSNVLELADGRCVFQGMFERWLDDRCALNSI